MAVQIRYGRSGFEGYLKNVDLIETDEYNHSHKLVIH